MEASDREEELKRLAVAFYSQPKGTAKELADAVGISKATFYRIYSSREHLAEILMERAQSVAASILRETDRVHTDYEEALRQMIGLHCREKEYLMFLCYGTVTGSCDDGCQEEYRRILSGFFLRGQKAGAFRIDLPAEVMTELFLGTIGALFEAESQGRVATAGLAVICEKFLLGGIRSE